MKDILLIEPEGRFLYPPLGLLKISTWHKKQGDSVQLVQGVCELKTEELFVDSEEEGLLKSAYDIIYVTSLFTYQLAKSVEATRYCQRRYPQAEILVGGVAATLLPEYVREKTGIEPHIGLLEGAEDCPPDYSLYPNLKYSISFTTRGCPNKCRFCAVRKHEPEFFVKENWVKDIDLSKKRIIFWDNNWLASPVIETDVEKLQELQGKGITSADFNQGLDCRLFDEGMAALLSCVNIRPLRFAFDSKAQEGYIQKAIKLAQKYGFKDIRVYVLYNFGKDDNDTPEYFYYRINELNKLGALSYPMCYRPIDSVWGVHISDKWDKELLRGLKLSLMFYYHKGMISRSREAFVKIYGDGAEGFRDRLCKLCEGDRRRAKGESNEHEGVGRGLFAVE